jgi:rod shape-determining protein MreD
MAKRYEFQADKPHSGLLDKLYITPKQRLSILKWTLLGLVLLFLSVLQDVVLCRFRLFGAATDLVPCAIFLICIMEGVDNGCIFAFVSSLIYQFSGSAPGLYAMVFLTIVAILAAIFRQSYLQKGFGAAFFCTSSAVFLYELLIFLMGLFLGLSIPDRFIGFLITSGLSLISLPLLYPLVMLIGKIGGSIWNE